MLHHRHRHFHLFHFYLFSKVLFILPSPFFLSLSLSIHPTLPLSSTFRNEHSTLPWESFMQYSLQWQFSFRLTPIYTQILSHINKYYYDARYEEAWWLHENTFFICFSHYRLLIRFGASKKTRKNQENKISSHRCIFHCSSISTFVFAFALFMAISGNWCVCVYNIYSMTKKETDSDSEFPQFYLKFSLRTEKTYIDRISIKSY